VSEVQREEILAILVPKLRSAIVRRELIAAIVPRNLGFMLAVASAIFLLAMLCGGGIYASVMAVSMLTVPLYLTILIAIGNRAQRRRRLQLQPVLAGAQRTDQTIVDAEIIAWARATRPSSGSTLRPCPTGSGNNWRVDV
jgi:hypothetical protein